MSELNEAHVESIVAACAENVEAIAQCFNSCFETTYRIAVGESTVWNSDEIAPELNGPGVMVAFQVGGQGIVCLIPQTVPLPSWYTNPNDSQSSRLQTLAMEWSLAMLPPDLESDQFLTVAVPNLRAELETLQPLNWAATLELKLLPAEGDENAQPAARLALVWPVASLPMPKAAPPAPKASVKSPPNPPRPVSPPPPAPSPVRTHRLMKLPVTIVVRLAEKKIEIGQLLSLSPGALITFNKSCEDMLDLYVNNRRYCRGEAVKIGEKFGLKVTEVGPEEIRERRVMNG